MNVNKNYKALLEGRMSKSEFLRQARQGLPQYITNITSFDDAIKILRQKSILAEDLVYTNKADQFPLESIQRGIRYELQEMDVVDDNSPTREEYKEARQRAIDNLCKDPLYYIYKIAGSDYKKVHKNEKEVEADDKMKKVVPGKKNLQEGKYTGNVAEAATSQEDERKANKYFLELYCKYKEGKYEIKDKESGEKKPGPALQPNMAAQRACIMVRKAYNLPRFRPNRDTMASLSVGQSSMQYQGEQDGKPTFNQSWNKSAATRGRGGQISERGYQPYRGSARGGVETSRAYQVPDDQKRFQKKQNPEGERVFTQVLAQLRDADKALKVTRKVLKDPNWIPSRDTMKNHQLAWLDRAKGLFTDAHPTWKEGKEMDIDKMVLKESIMKVIGKVLNEAATANLAQFSDDNATISELPAAINSLENIVTEIESFWLKEQQKIQGVFDSLGNIKNEDGMPIGYKFAQPAMESLKKDLEPVFAKITLDEIKLPEAPAPDETQVNDPNAPEGVPPIPEKETVFSPAKEPLQESKKNKRYTK